MHPHSESDQIFIFLPGSSCKLDKLGLRGCRKSQGRRDEVLNRGGEEKARGLGPNKRGRQRAFNASQSGKVSVGHVELWMGL